MEEMEVGARLERLLQNDYNVFNFGNLKKCFLVKILIGWLLFVDY